MAPNASVRSRFPKVPATPPTASCWPARRARDEAAFAAVARTGRTVLGVCRRVLHNPHDATTRSRHVSGARPQGRSPARPELLGNLAYGVANRALKATHRAARERAGPAPTAHRRRKIGGRVCGGYWSTNSAACPKYRAPACQ